MQKSAIFFESQGAVPDKAVLLISLDWTRDKDPRVPLGHASLLTSLQGMEGLDVTGLSYAMNRPGFAADEVVSDILRWVNVHPGVELNVALGVYIWNDIHVRYIIEELQEHQAPVRLVLGGPQISYTGSGLEELYPGVDVFIRGYGEEALRAVLTGGNAPGVHRAGSHDLAQQAVVDFERLPSPFLQGIVDVTQGQRFIRWETRRGCSFRCSFCQHREAGKRLRKRELGIHRLRDELRLFASHDVGDIAVLDPIFNHGEHYLDLLEELIRLDYQGRLSLQCRFEWVTEEFLDLCAQLNAQLEFGLQTIHRSEGKAVRRVNHMDRVQWAMAELHRREIFFEVSLIFGLPEQTIQSFRESVDYCLRQRVPTIKAFPLMLLRGTELDKERERWSLRESEHAIPMVIGSSSFDEYDWQRMA
ncbi:MAG: B12-binding domain-containing radical SAM protein, partial [Bradymonadaceae bacterium]